MSRLSLFFLAVLVAALIYPISPFADDYILHVMTLTMVYMILALGLNIVPGFCGLLDLGFVGFYGIGAYTAGLLTIHYGVPFWFIVPLAALNGALWGIMLGAPTLRLTGDYFAIVTFGFSELVVLFLTNEIWLTRGPLGLPGIDPVSFDLDPDSSSGSMRPGNGTTNLISERPILSTWPLRHGFSDGFRLLRPAYPIRGLPPGPGLVRHPGGPRGRRQLRREPAQLQGHRLRHLRRRGGHRRRPFRQLDPFSFAGHVQVLGILSGAVHGGAGGLAISTEPSSGPLFWWPWARCCARCCPPWGSRRKPVSWPTA